MEEETNKENESNKVTKIKEKSFKEKWNSVDEVCPLCKQVTKRNIGLTKQNIGRLFKKPTTEEWLIFIIVILMIFAALTYKTEIQQCKNFKKNPEMYEYYYDKELDPMLNHSLDISFDDLNYQKEEFQIYND